MLNERCLVFNTFWPRVFHNCIIELVIPVRNYSNCEQYEVSSRQYYFYVFTWSQVCLILKPMPFLYNILEIILLPILYCVYIGNLFSVMGAMYPKATDMLPFLDVFCVAFRFSIYDMLPLMVFITTPLGCNEQMVNGLAMTLDTQVRRLAVNHSRSQYRRR